jgi:hypothetical protein
MNLYDKVSTGIKGFDQVIDHLRFGDNVVWQVDSVSDYKKMVDYFGESAQTENMSLVYIRFANHEPLFDTGGISGLIRLTQAEALRVLPLKYTIS